MNLEVQWFIFNITAKKFMTQDQCDILINDSDKNIDISSFAQKAFDSISANLDEVSAEILLDHMEKIMTESIEHATHGFSPKEASTEDIENYELIFSKIPTMPDDKLKYFVRKLLHYLKDNSTSDLHFSANSPPFIRHTLKISKKGNYILTKNDAHRINTIFLSEEQSESFKINKELTYALSFSKEERYRVALMNQKDGISGTYHILPNHIKNLAELGFKPKKAKTISTFLNHHNGLILIAGPIGSGKTTTLASLVDIMNNKRHDHIIMVEDPIEIVQESKNCNITQREIITHTESYAKAIKGALREDPDVIVIGELNDLKTIEIAITASETGHLVIGTLPTGDTINTLNRIVDVFPPSQQPQIRAMISGSLRGIVCQKQIKTLNNKTTIACEILVNNLAASNTISDGKHHLLKPILQTSSKLGMCTMDESIFELYKDNTISGEVAMKYIKDKNSYKSKITITD